MKIQISDNLSSLYPEEVLAALAAHFELGKGMEL